MIRKIITLTLITIIISTNFIFSNNKVNDDFSDLIKLKLDIVDDDFDEKRITISNYKENTFYELPLENSLQCSGFMIKDGIVEFKFSDYKQYESIDDTNPISLTAYKVYTSSPYFSKILNQNNYNNTKIKLDEKMTFIVIDSTKNNSIHEDENCLTLFFNQYEN